MSNRAMPDSPPLRAVTSREQLTNDPDVDLNRTAVDLVVLLNDFDVAKLGFSNRDALLRKVETVEEPVAHALVDAARKRLNALLNRELAPTKNKPSPSLSAQTASGPSLSSSVVSNFGGATTLHAPNQWFDGPPILFEAAGRVGECRYTVRLDLGVSANLLLQIRKLNSVAGCVVVNDLSARVENFRDVAVEGYWQMSFLHFGAKSTAPLKVELHQLQFDVH